MTNKEMKSKAMALGNKLAVKGNDRSAAFVKAWAIVKAGGLELAVKGVTFGSRQEALRRLSTYNPADVRAFVVPEPNNPVDRNALAIVVGIQNGRGLYRLGYVPKETAALVRAMGSRPVNLRVVSGEWDYKGRGHVTFGARVSLAV